MKREISKSGTLPPDLLIMKSRDSEIKQCHVTLLPTPLATTFIQNKFRTVGLVRNKPLVLGPKHADTYGNTMPMCSSMGALVPSKLGNGSCRYHMANDSAKQMVCCRQFHTAWML